MTTRDVGTAELLTPGQKCTNHSATFEYSIGLPRTDDSLVGEKVANFEISKLTKKKNCFQLVYQNVEKENITTLGKVFLV